MSVIQAILMGILQGLTEFLPVSSSGHLAVFRGWFSVETDGGILFDILLHLATLIAVFAVYYKDVIMLLVEFFGICVDCIFNIRIFFKNLSAINKEPYKKICTSPYRKLVVMLIVSTIPTGILGILLDDVVEAASDNLLCVGLCLLGTGCILFLSDYIEIGKKKQKEANFGDAMCVGISQGLATLPGISRSGTTITCCLLCGFDRKFAAKYSFIMSMPVILGALILELFKLPEAGGVGVSGLGCFLAMLFAAAIGYVALKLVNKLVLTRNFRPFGVWCMLIGAISIIVFLVRL